MSLVMLAMLFLMQERMHSPAPATEEGPPSKSPAATSASSSNACYRSAAKIRGTKKKFDEFSKRESPSVRKTSSEDAQAPAIRPPLWPDEDLTQMTE